MTRFKRSNQIKKASAILSADWHLRPDVPIGRTDDYFAAMERKVDFILALSKQHECPILIAGDLGNKPQWPNWLLSWTISKFQFVSDVIWPPVVIAGQHDLPNHRLDLWQKSGIGVLTEARVIDLIGTKGKVEFSSCKDFVIYPFSYGIGIDHIGDIIKPRTQNIPKIAMTHQMVIENKPLWPGQEAPKGNQLLKKFPEYNLILSGDNHKPFTVEYEGRWLVNPGSMMRSTAAQIEHKPRVYLWYAETNEIGPVYLPIEQGVIERTHIDSVQERDNRFNALITRVKNDVEIKLSYPNNIENYFQKYRTEIPVKNKVWQAVI